MEHAMDFDGVISEQEDDAFERTDQEIDNGGM